MRHPLPRLGKRPLPKLRTSPALIVNLVLALALAGVAVWAYTSFGTAEAAETGAAGTRTVAAAQGTVTATVSSSGTVRSASTATATFGTSGTVTAIRVQVGDKVTKGQVLATVGDTAAQRDLDAARTNLDAAQDALERAQDADSDTSEAETQVSQAENDVDEAEEGVAGTTLKAPMAGTVTAVNGSVGSAASGSGSSGGSPNGAASGDTESDSSTGFIELADLSRLEVAASVAEADATKLKTGQTATITWNALPDAESTATLSAIDPNATTENNVVTYGVTLTLDDLPAGVRAGQSVNVSITVGQTGNVIYVNSAAVTTAGNRHTVTVLENGQRTARVVEIGLEGESTTEITSGLAAGEQVVLTTPSTSNQGTFPGGGFPAGGGGPGGGFPGGGSVPGGGRVGGAPR